MNTFAFSPGLTQLRDWAREKQTDIDVPVNERALWKQIADEIDEFTQPAVVLAPVQDSDDLFGGPR